MTIFAIIISAATAIVLFFVFLRPGASRTNQREVHRIADELQGFDPVKLGRALNEEEETLRTQLAHRLLALSPEENQNSWRKRLLFSVLSATGVLAGGIALYFQIGTPGLSPMPYHARADERAGIEEIKTRASQLRAYLESENGGDAIEGWVYLASLYENLGQFAEAEAILARIIDRPDISVKAVRLYLDILFELENQQPSSRLVYYAKRALQLAPDDPHGVYYLALGQMAFGSPFTAHELFIERARRGGRAAPWASVFLEIANQIGREQGLALVKLRDLPERENRIPGLSEIMGQEPLTPEAQEELIAKMVARFEEALGDAPQDIDGWIRLGRVSLLLPAQKKKALGAFREAKKILEENASSYDPRHFFVEAMLEQLEPL